MSFSLVCPPLLGTMRESISTGPGLEGTLTDVTFGAGDCWVVSPGTVRCNITLDRRNRSFSVTYCGLGRNSLFHTGVE